MHPVSNRIFSRSRNTLRNLRFMMRKQQILSAAMNIKRLAEIFSTHRRTFDMPARESLAPGRRPMHDVFGSCFLPQGEVDRISLLVLSFEFATFISGSR